MLNRFYNKLEIRDEVIFITCFIFVFIGLSWLSLYNHPSFDDYAETTTVWKWGLWGAQKFWYTHLTGRYFALFILSLNPLVFGATFAYKLNVIILLLLMLLAGYWTTTQLFGNLTKQARLGLVSLFILSDIFLMPDIAQGLYWQSGSYATYIPSILFILLLGSVAKFYKTGHYRFLSLSSLLCIAIVGSYEFFLLYTDFFCVLLVLFFILLKKKINYPALLLLAICILFSAISVSAPGNYVRANLYPNHYHFANSVFQALKFSFFYLNAWKNFILLFSVILLDFILKRISPKDGLASFFNISPIYTLLILISILPSGLFLIFWAEGYGSPIPRVVNIILFYFLVSYMLFLFNVSYYINRKFRFLFPRAVKLLVYALLLFITVRKPNNIKLVSDTLRTGIAAKYNKEMTEMHDYLITSKCDSCYIDSIKHIPQALFFQSQLPADTSRWEYKTFCAYYHKKYVHLK